MHAAFPRRAPAWPLLATLGLHLLLAWSWRIAYPPAPAPDAGSERVFTLIPVAPPAPVEPQVRPLLPRPPLSRTPRARSDSASAAAVTPPADAPASVIDPFAITLPDAPSQPASDTVASRARREAGIIDRELRRGKSGVPEVADTPMGRFRAGLEGAYRDSSRGVTSDSYTAPDGQVIYRFRLGGKVWCRTGGSVGPMIGGAEGGGATMFDKQGGGGTAGAIRCPSHGEWK